MPGGFIKIDETAEECARRKLDEETGLKNIAIEHKEKIKFMREIRQQHRYIVIDDEANNA